MSDSVALPLPIEVLPHRDSMLLLQQVLACSSERLQATGGVPSGTAVAAACGERATSMLVVEMAAQAGAYHACVEAVMQGEPAETKGYLVRLRQVQLQRADVEIKAEVDIDVSLESRMAGLGVYRFRCSVEQRIVATGSLSILRGSDGVG